MLFSMRGVSNIDISCAQTLRELVEGLRKKGVDVAILRHDHPRNENDGPFRFTSNHGDENFDWSVERVLLTNRPRPAAKSRLIKKRKLIKKLGKKNILRS